VIELGVASRDRKTAIVGGIVVLSLLLAGRGVPAWHRWRINAKESTESVLAEASEVAGSVDRAREFDAANRRAALQRMEVRPAFVNGTTQATAAANLGAIVADAATGNGVRMGSLQTSTDSATGQGGTVAHLRVRGEGTGDVTAVTQFLATLEGGLPIVAVRELSITQGEPRAPPDRPESLHVGFVIEALAHLDPTGPSK
jgi:hypothetical protein